MGGRTVIWQVLIRLGAISAALAAAISLQAAGPAMSTGDTPMEGGYTLVRDVKTASFSQMLGLYPIPGAPDEAVVITQNGYLWRISLSDSFAPVAFGNISSKLHWGGEEGLLGLAFSPQYETDRRVYLYYTSPHTPPGPEVCCRDRLARFQVINNTLDIGSEVLVLDQVDRQTWHVGGQLAFGPDGYLYASLGDEGGEGDPYNNAQNKAALYGKILRLDVTGQSTYAIPPGNPFADGPGGNADEIFAYGFRNPWRFSFDAPTGAMWAGDAGQNGWEEVDHVVSGGNYGWNIMEGSSCFSYPGCAQPPGYVPPRAVYCHNNYVPSCPNAGDCAVIGGFVYRGPAMPELDGWYVFGDYCSGRIWALDTASSDSPPILLTDAPYPISTFAQLPDGELVVLTYNKVIHRLVSDDTDDDDDGSPDDIEGECGGYIDDDGNGLVNDGCLQVATAAENGTQCLNAIDDDADGWINDGCPGSAETNACGSDRLDPDSVPERIDTVGDDNNDGQTNEALPPSAADYDCDGDGFTGVAEQAVGTNPQDPCGNSGWPADLQGSENRLNIGDFNSFLLPLRADGSLSKLGHPVPDPEDAGIARWNISPDDVINIRDLNALNPAVHSPTARPPMFGGQPAFFADAGNGVGGCPLPP